MLLRSVSRYLQDGWQGSRPATIVLLALLLAAPRVGLAQVSEDKELARLINSASTPLPVVPIVVPQLQGSGAVDSILAPGELPTLFQISQPDGPYAAAAEVRFFQMLAVEYALKVNFRKLAAGSPAARRLYSGVVTKPFYVLCDPGRPHDDRCAFINEAAMPAGHEVKQTTIENFIYKRLAIPPTLLTTQPITAANARSTILGSQTNAPDPAAVGMRTLIIFFRGASKDPGPINRLRELLALERFFYGNRLNIAECDLSTAADVYKTVLTKDATASLPTAPELWLIDPATHENTQYVPGDSGSAYTDLTHGALQAWLAKNGVAAPPDRALDAEAAWHELTRLKNGRN